MNRRHFMSHLAGAAALAAPATAFTNTLLANAEDMKKRHKAAILLWMGGGPSTMDIWDLKPGTATGGPFKQISTSADGVAISEHMPLMAQQMHQMAVVRSMSTREADHMRGRYYMHTGYVPNPNVEHPSYGAVIAHELAAQVPELEIPPFVSVGGGSVGPGFLGMTWAPFVVDSSGRVRNLDMGIDQARVQQRLEMLATIEKRFIGEDRGGSAQDHAKVLDRTVKLMTSEQMKAFKVDEEPEAVRERYGTAGFGRGCLMARRLVEQGVPFVEVDLGGWDNHQGIFTTLADTKLPELDQAMSALVEDLVQRGLYDDTAVIWMGEFGRTPNINGDGGRDHWARSWSVVVGGAGFRRGVVVGETSSDGKEIVTEPYSSQDMMASVLKSLGISLETTFTAANGRPMKIANSGRVIQELFA
ncbi:MAG: DUF1501 domain-containing protein [Pirellulales bacterium]|jgi:uncharacterized protein (DUF1501 family)|nr:DUF1501 domain-containing protein [Pirellulales bacterium]MBL7192438.1 DUF1501 domain-containing protein [Pirellulales bacterium]